ncbi:MAG: helix-turn-helix domain-containing protein [Bacteroidaceae bacterium]|nr:helix-turn-helix domain-containing protein [Bacteroidaceae bacterium]
MNTTVNKSPFLMVSYISVADNSTRSFPEYDLFYILDGTVRVSDGSNTYFLSKGDVFLYEPGVKYLTSSGGNNAILTVVIDKQFFLNAMEGRKGRYVCNSAYDSSRDYEPIRQHLLQIADAHGSDSKNSSLRLNALAYSLLFYLKEYHFEEEEEETIIRNLPSAAAERLDAVRDYIHANYANNITLQNVADSLDISAPYLSSFFKKNMGVNFNSYLNNVRLEQAVNELENTDRSITEITYDVGFPSMNAFHKLFKEKYQTTPLKYRNDVAAKQMEQSDPEELVVTELNPNDMKELIDPLTRDTFGSFYEIKLPVQQHIEVENAHRTTKTAPIWKSMITLGKMNIFNTHYIENQIRGLQGLVGFKYARLEEVVEINKSSFMFDLDMCFDILLNINMIPYLELSIPVEELEIRGNELVVNHEEYLDFVDRLMKHCANLHGLDYLEQCIFEINPHIDLGNNRKESFESAATRFAKTYRLIKSYVPDAKVGGVNHNLMLPRDDMKRLLPKIKELGVMPDFLSVGGFPVDAPKNLSTGSFVEECVYSADKNYYRNKIRRYKKTIRESFGVGIPVYISYMAPVLFNQLYLNDSVYQSSFLFHNIVSLLDEVELLGIYRLSDIGDREIKNEFLFGGSGLVNIYGLLKPGAHVLSIFSNCRTNLVAKGEDFAIFKGNAERYMIGLCNYTYLSDVFRHNLGSLIPVEEAYSVYESPKTKNVQISLDNLAPGIYDVIQFQVNKEHGSILDEWQRNHFWTNFNRDELEHLKGINQPKRTHFSRESHDGSLHIQLQLSPHEVVFLAMFLRV